jgi:hypothetical protein
LHKQFRSRLTSNHTRGRPTPVTRTMRRILEDNPL